MAKIYGALEVAQLEWFTQSPDTRPSAASNTYRVIYASDVKQVQISDGTNWIAFLNTSTNQTIAGDITFSGQQIFNGLHRLSVTTDSSSTGAITALNNTTPVIEFTAAVTSISGIANSASGATVMLVNRTGGTVAVLDEDTGATAANRIRTGTGAQISLANNASIILTYVGDSRWHIVGGSGSGSGSAGINYITNGSAEADTLGWATYAESDAVTFQDAGDTVTLNNHGLSNGSQISFTSITSTTGISTNTLYYVISATTNTFQVATTATGSALPLTTNGSGTLVRFVPKTGSGGSSSLTIARNTTNPLIGTASFILTKGGSANLEGQGWEYDFTIDRGYQAKVLQISFQYLVNSGTFVAGTSSTVSDVTVYIYDVTNAQVIQPSSFKLLSNNASISDTFNATFQTASNSTSYRLIFHVSTPSTSDYSLKVDGISVSPSTYVYGTPVTDWQNFTPTGSWVANTTYTGKYRRVGDTLEVQTAISLTGAPTAANLTVNLPSGFVSDSSKTTSVGLTDVMVSGQVLKGATGYAITGYLNTTTSIALIYISNGANSAESVVTFNAPVTFANGDAISISYRVPIQGWSSSVQTSDQTDTRVVAAKTTASSVTSNTTTPIVFNAVINDTHGAITLASGRFLAPVSGFYTVTAQITSGTVGAWNLVAYVDGVSNTVLAYLNTNVGQASGSQIIYLNAGQYVDLRTSVSVSGISGTFGFFRLTGPSAIAASETVACRYTNIAGTSVGTTDTQIPFATKDYDSHNAYTSPNYLVPVSGKYSVSVLTTMAALTLSTGQALQLNLYKNGSFFMQLGFVLGNGSSNSYRCNGSGDINCVAGDTLSIYLSSGTAGNLTTQVGYNYMNIKRVGN